ncbi:MAG: aminotransferase, partial [Pseudarthrobacter sp.]|nr:aminotransferase [Pseudarthrobacter sp.]
MNDPTATSQSTSAVSGRAARLASIPSFRRVEAYIHEPQRDVFVLPGVLFETPGFFRISLTANEDMIERSLPAFEAALKE